MPVPGSDGLTGLCRTLDVPEDGGLRIDTGSGAVAVFRVGTEYFVIDDLCTHGSASLSEGEVDGEEVVCPYHLGRFSLRTGEATGPPCLDPVRCYPATIADGQLLVLLPDRADRDLALDGDSAGYDR